MSEPCPDCGYDFPDRTAPGWWGCPGCGATSWHGIDNDRLAELTRLSAMFDSRDFHSAFEELAEARRTRDMMLFMTKKLFEENNDLRTQSKEDEHGPSD